MRHAFGLSKFVTSAVWRDEHAKMERSLFVREPAITGGSMLKLSSCPDKPKPRTRTKMRASATTVWQFGALFISSVLLLCVCPTVQATSLRPPVNCVYANSTLSSCPSVCESDVFYNLFPASCHPASESLLYSDAESHPDRPSSSLEFSQSSFVIPSELIPPTAALSDGYSIALNYRLLQMTGSLFELDTNSGMVALSIVGSNIALQLGSEEFTLTAAPNPTALQRVLITLLPNTATEGSAMPLDEHSVLVYQSDPLPQVFSFSMAKFPDAISNIEVAANGFVSFLQDFRIYSPPLNGFELPPEANFLPQCLCPSGYVLSDDASEDMCLNAGTPAGRFRSTACVAEFAADTSTNPSTLWQSEIGEDPITITLGLEPPTSLSKVFIEFEAAVPRTTVLEYLHFPNRTWLPLQYFADDCQMRFGMETGAQLVASTGANCLLYNGTTLSFLLAASGRPRPSLGDTSLEEHFNASQVRLTMDGLGGASNLQIRNLEVCPNFCFDLQMSCDTECQPLSASTSTGLDSTAVMAITSSTTEPVMSSSEATSSTETQLLASVATSSEIQATSTLQAAINTSTSEFQLEFTTTTITELSATSSQPILTSEVESSSTEPSPSPTLPVVSSEAESEASPSPTLPVVSSEAESEASPSPTLPVVSSEAESEASPSPTLPVVSSEAESEASPSPTLPVVSSEAESEPSPSPTLPVVSSEAESEASPSPTLPVVSSEAESEASPSPTLPVVSSEAESEASPSPTLPVVSSEAESEPSPSPTLPVVSSEAESEPSPSPTLPVVSSEAESEPSPSPTLPVVSSEAESEPSPSPTLPVVSSEAESEPSPSPTLPVVSSEAESEASPSPTLSVVSSEAESEPSPSPTLPVVSSEAEIASSSSMQLVISSSNVVSSSDELLSSSSSSSVTQSSAEPSTSSSQQIIMVTEVASSSVGPVPSETISEVISTAAELSSSQQPTVTSEVVASSSTETISEVISTAAELSSSQQPTVTSEVVASSSTELQPTVSATSSEVISFSVEPSPSPIATTSSVEPQPISSSDTISSSTESQPAVSTTSSEVISFSVEPSPSPIATTSSVEPQPISSSDTVSSSTELLPAVSTTSFEVISFSVEPSPSPTQTIATAITSSTESQPAVSATSSEVVSFSVEPSPSPIATTSSVEPQPISSSDTVSSSTELQPAVSTTSFEVVSFSVEPSPSPIATTSSVEPQPISSSDTVSSSTELQPAVSTTSFEVVSFSVEPSPSPTQTIATAITSSTESQPAVSATGSEVVSFSVEPSPSPIATTSSVEPQPISSSDTVSSSTELQPAVSTTSFEVVSFSVEPSPSPTQTIATAITSSTESQPAVSATSSEVVSFSVEPSPSPIATTSSVEPQPISSSDRVSSSTELQPAVSSTSFEVISFSVEPSPSPTQTIATAITSSTESQPAVSATGSEVVSFSVEPSPSPIAITSSVEPQPISSSDTVSSSTELQPAVSTTSFEVVSFSVEPSPSPTQTIATAITSSTESQLLSSSEILIVSSSVETQTVVSSEIVLSSVEPQPVESTEIVFSSEELSTTTQPLSSSEPSFEPSSSLTPPVASSEVDSSSFQILSSSTQLEISSIEVAIEPSLSQPTLISTAELVFSSVEPTPSPTQPISSSETQALVSSEIPSSSAVLSITDSSEVVTETSSSLTQPLATTATESSAAELLPSSAQLSTTTGSLPTPQSVPSTSIEAVFSSVEPAPFPTQPVESSEVVSSAESSSPQLIITSEAPTSSQLAVSTAVASGEASSLTTQTVGSSEIVFTSPELSPSQSTDIVPSSVIFETTSLPAVTSEVSSISVEPTSSVIEPTISSASSAVVELLSSSQPAITSDTAPTSVASSQPLTSSEVLFSSAVVESSSSQLVISTEILVVSSLTVISTEVLVVSSLTVLETPSLQPAVSTAVVLSSVEPSPSPTQSTITFQLSSSAEVETSQILVTSEVVSPSDELATTFTSETVSTLQIEPSSTVLLQSTFSFELQPSSILQSETILSSEVISLEPSSTPLSSDVVEPTQSTLQPSLTSEAISSLQASLTALQPTEVLSTTLVELSPTFTTEVLTSVSEFVVTSELVASSALSSELLPTFALSSALEASPSTSLLAFSSELTSSIELTFSSEATSFTVEPTASTPQPSFSLEVESSSIAVSPAVSQSLVSIGVTLSTQLEPTPSLTSFDLITSSSIAAGATSFTELTTSLEETTSVIVPSSSIVVETSDIGSGMDTSFLTPTLSFEILETSLLSLVATSTPLPAISPTSTEVFITPSQSLTSTFREVSVAVSASPSLSTLVSSEVIATESSIETSTISPTSTEVFITLSQSLTSTFREVSVAVSASPSLSTLVSSEVIATESSIETSTLLSVSETPALSFSSELTASIEPTPQLPETTSVFIPSSSTVIDSSDIGSGMDTSLLIPTLSSEIEATLISSPLVIASSTVPASSSIEIFITPSQVSVSLSTVMISASPLSSGLITITSSEVAITESPAETSTLFTVFESPVSSTVLFSSLLPSPIETATTQLPETTSMFIPSSSAVVETSDIGSGLDTSFLIPTLSSEIESTSISSPEIESTSISSPVSIATSILASSSSIEILITPSQAELSSSPVFSSLILTTSVIESVVETSTLFTVSESSFSSELTASIEPTTLLPETTSIFLPSSSIVLETSDVGSGMDTSFLFPSSSAVQSTTSTLFSSQQVTSSLVSPTPILPSSAIVSLESSVLTVVQVTSEIESSVALSISPTIEITIASSESLLFPFDTSVVPTSTVAVISPTPSLPLITQLVSSTPFPSVSPTLASISTASFEESSSAVVLASSPVQSSFDISPTTTIATSESIVPSESVASSFIQSLSTLFLSPTPSQSPDIGSGGSGDTVEPFSSDIVTSIEASSVVAITETSLPVLTTSITPSFSPVLTSELFISPTTSAFISPTSAVIETTDSVFFTPSPSTSVPDSSSVVLEPSSENVFTSSIETVSSVSSLLSTLELSPSFSETIVVPTSDVLFPFTSTEFTSSTVLTPTESLIVSTPVFSSSILESSTPLLSTLLSTVASTQAESLIVSTPVFSSSLFGSSTPLLSTLLSTVASTQTESLSVSTPVFSSSIFESSTPLPSVVLTSTLAVPSPSPSPSPTQTPRSVPVRAPIDVAAVGVGFVLDDVAQYVDDEVEYDADIGPFIPTLSDESDSFIEATFGEFSSRSDSYSIVDGSSDSVDDVAVSVAVARDTIYSDDPYIHVAIQGRDSSLSTHLDIELVVMVTNLETSMNEIEYCNTTSPSGLCTAIIQVPIEWFSSGSSNTPLEVTVMMDDIPIATDQTITLEPMPISSLNDTLFMTIPTHPVRPGRALTIPIYANFEFLLAHFNLDCSVTSSAEIKGATATETWGLITSLYPDSFNRMSLTGFRNYDKSSVERIPDLKPELLASLNIDIPSSSDDSALSIQCKVETTILNTGTFIKQEYVQAIDRTGVNNKEGTVFLEKERVVVLFAYSRLNEAVNIANLTQEVALLPLNVAGFTTYGELLNLTDNLECFSDNNEVIQVYENCAHIFFDGSETQGSNEASITVNLIDDLEVNASMPFRVWWPSDIMIMPAAGDYVLNRIETCSDSMYQSTKVSIFASIQTDSSSSTFFVSLSSILHRFLASTDRSTLHINTTSGTIQGLQPGNTTVFLNGTSLSPSMEIEVSDTSVQPEYLDIFAFSGIQVNTEQEYDRFEEQRINITLLQEFSFINSELNIVAVAVFSDNHTMALLSSDIELTVSMLSSNSPISPSSYRISEAVNNITIAAKWTEMDCVILSDSLTVTVIEDEFEIPELIVLVTPTPAVITPRSDPGYNLSTSDFVLLQAILRYSDRNISVNNATNLHVSSDPTGFVEHTFVEGGIKITAVNGPRLAVTVTVAYDTFNLSSEVDVTVIESMLLMLTAYPYDGPNTSITSLHLIGQSGIYQKARIKSQLHFSNGTIVDISELVTLQSTSETLANQVLSVKDPGTVTMHGNFNNITSVPPLEITVLNASAEVVQIDQVFISEFDNDMSYADCTVTLSDNTILSQTFSNGTPLYPNLILFRVSNESVSSVDATSGVLRVHANSHESVTLMATSVSDGNVNRTVNFYANLQAKPGETDLGNTDGTPLNSVMQNTSFPVPVFLNTGLREVGVFELDIYYTPTDSVEFLGVVQGTNWRNGSIIFAENEKGIVKLGGVLNTGTNNSGAHLADLNFEAQKAGLTDFSVTIRYLAEATVQLDLVPVNNSRPFSSQIQVEIASRDRISKRSTSLVTDPIVRYKRRSEQCPLENIDSNCMVDLRDLYLLQEYLAAEVYNFSTTSGMEVLSEVLTEEDLSFADISRIERISLNLDFTVENVTVDFVPQPQDPDQCLFVVTGVIQTSDGNPLPFPDPRVLILLNFSSDNETFQEDFNDTFENVVRLNDSPPYGGVISPTLEADNGTTIFNVEANSSFTSGGFDISVILVVMQSNINVIPTDDDLSQLVTGFDAETFETLSVTDVTCVVVTPSSTMLFPSSEFFTSSVEVSSSPVQVSTLTTTVEVTTAFAAISTEIAVPTSVRVFPSAEVSSTPAIATSTVLPEATSSPIVTTTSVAITNSTVLPEATSSPIVTTTSVAMTNSTVLPEVTSSRIVTTTSVAMTNSTVLPEATSSPIVTTTSVASTRVVASTSLPLVITSVSTSSTLSPLEVTSTTIVAVLTSTALEVVSTTPVAAVTTTALEITPSPTAAPTTTTTETSVVTSVETISSPELATTQVVAPSSSPLEPTSSSEVSLIPSTSSAFAEVSTTFTQAPTSQEAPPTSTTSSLQATTSAEPTSTAQSSVVSLTSSTDTITSVLSTSTPEVTQEATSTQTEPPTTETTSATITVSSSTTTTSIPGATTSTTDQEATRTSVSTSTSQSSSSTSVPVSTSTQAPSPTSEPPTQPTSSEPSTEPTPTPEVSTEPTSPPSSEPPTDPTSTTDVSTEPTSPPSSEPPTDPTSTTDVSTEPTSPPSSEPPTDSTSTTDVSTEPTSPPSSDSPTDLTSSEAPTSSSSSSSTPAISTTATAPAETPTIGVTPPTTSSSSTTAAVIGGMGVIVAILLVIIVIFIVIWVRRRANKRGEFRPNETRSASRSKAFWFNEEENIEMSPIDIVPMHSQHYDDRFMREASIDVIPNHHIYTDEDHNYASGSSGKALIRQPPPPHIRPLRPPPQVGKQAYGSYQTETEPPPPYQSNASEIEEEEEDDLIDLRFTEEFASQPYLSLGLTPLSQQSLTDTTGTGNELGFFPSMLPPVTPMTSSALSGSSSGIPADSPFNLNSHSVPVAGGMVMPDANPMVAEPRRTRRQKHHDLCNPLSQGYAIKLETVPEQTEDLHRRGYSGHGIENGVSSSSSEEFPESQSMLLFPSADMDTEYMSHSQLQRQKGKRRKSGMRRGVLESEADDPSTVVANDAAFQNGYGDHGLDAPVKLSREDVLRSPRQELKFRRMKARDHEISKQKAIVKQKMIEEETKKRLLQERRAEKIAHDYGSTRTRAPLYEPRAQPKPSNLVLREAAKYEARVEVLTEKNSQSSTTEERPNRKNSSDLIHMFDQVTTL